MLKIGGSHPSYGSPWHEVIGSLPRPAWMRDVILDRKDGRVSEAEADRLLDRTIESAVALQERAGLDEITNGEWRRESYVKVFAERVRGFQAELGKRAGWQVIDLRPRVLRVETAALCLAAALGLRS